MKNQRTYTVAELRAALGIKNYQFYLLRAKGLIPEGEVETAGIRRLYSHEQLEAIRSNEIVATYIND